MYFGVYFFWWNHLVRFKMVHSNTKNAKSRVRQCQVCCLRACIQQIPLPLTHERKLSRCLVLYRIWDKYSGCVSLLVWRLRIVLIVFYSGWVNGAPGCQSKYLIFVLISDFFFFFFFFSFRIWNIPKHLPSAGMIVYSIASTFCDKISLFGFYPYLTDCHNKTLSYHYYDKPTHKSSIPGVHKMPKEHGIYKSLHKLGYIKLMTGDC